MHNTLTELTSQDAMILQRLALRPYTNKAFRIVRAMQEGDAADYAQLVGLISARVKT
jgi:hypothetical protein